MLRNTIVTAVVLVMLAVSAQALAANPGPTPPPPPPPLPLGIWQDQRAVKELGLSGKQIAALKDLENNFKKEMRPAAEEVERAVFEMEKAFAQDRFDERAVRDLAAKVSEGQAKMFNLGIDARIGLHQILTPDQFKTLKILPPPPPPQCPGQGQGPGPMPGR
ncbi:MAG: periplasmic heavy metal sensor [Deltaproteobacteria bacterium]|nr:periplasmic heavy metal sensor [Deltaproteobacteria bacterium]